MRLFYLAVVSLMLSLLPLAAAAPPKATPSDAAIEASLRQRLGRSKIGANGFQFRVRGGVVTWTGKTGVIQHKGAATRMAKAAGARRVDNQIQISEEARRRAAAKLQGRAHAAAAQPDAPPKRAQITRPN